MAAIQVYKTDTFEIQRQKINEIGIAISGFSGGGNDFAAGNLKLGDGTVDAPSLSFTSDNTLGIYKPYPNTLGFASSGKGIFEISDIGSNFLKTFVVETNSVTNSQIRIDSRGSNYDAYTYTNVPLTGGLGDGATGDFTVVEFLGSITNNGQGYLPGDFTSILLSGGSGTGATANFSVDALQGQISDNGSGYLLGGYEGVSFINVSGSGSGATCDVVVDENGIVTFVVVRNQGSGYQSGDVLSVSDADLGQNGGSGFEFTITTNPGVIRDFQFTTKGSGYSSLDVLSLRQGITASTTLTSGSAQITVSNSSTITVGDRVEVISGTGVLGTGITTVFGVSGNTVTLSKNATVTGTANISIFPPYGNGSTQFQYSISQVGVVETFTPNQGGSGYVEEDILSVDPESLVRPNLVGVQAVEVQKLSFSPGTIPAGTFFPGSTIQNDDGDEGEIYKVTSSGGSIVEIIAAQLDLVPGGIITAGEDTYTIDNAFTEYRWFLDTSGEGFFFITPDLTLIPGETYIFDFSYGLNFEEHTFSLSRFPGGNKGRGLIEGVTTTISSTSTDIVVSDATGILEGMLVTVVSGTGSLITDTRVAAISGTTITLTKQPLLSGSATLKFTGVEYTTKTERTETTLILQVTEDTPNLYYYCSRETTVDINHDNEGGDINDEGLFTVDLANPRTVFGSGFQITLAEINSVNTISGNSSTGNLDSVSITSETATITDITSSGVITANTINTSNFIIDTRILAGENGSNTIDYTGDTLNIDSNVNFTNTIQIQNSNGNITTSGRVKSGATGFNSNDFLNIVNNVISTTTGNNLVLDPADLRVAKIDATTALVIPVGSNSQRPQAGVVETGAIRFNTSSQQYEGYNAVAAAWSSLGGIRDVDGNTYILAEATTGANDNTFYFVNNTQNTLRLTTQYLDFRTTKKIRSENMSAPAYVNWTPNAFASVGDYIRYKTNVYEVISVTGSSQLAGSANPPTHDVGAEFNNEVELLWFTSAVDTITFEEVSAVQIDPNGTAPLIVNNELVLESSVIRSEVNDIIIRPFTGKKVEIFAKSSLVIPVGNVNDRGSAKIGSIRFNTDILQYEGYDGANWSSLGGVRDVDGNTYIIPELGAGTNENILFFYNDDNNTLQLSASGLDFYSTDNITSSQSNVLNINVPTVAFNSSEFTIDNSGTSTVLTSSKETIDFNLSTGLTTENLISFTDEGGIIINNTYSEGSVSNITVLDYQLKDFELSDMKTSTDDLVLVRGTINSRSTIVYDPSVHVSGKLSVIVENVTKNERELIEFNICHKGSDIFYTEYGNISTNGELIATAFDFTAANEVRATFTLNSVNNDNGDTVNIVAIKTLIKK